MLNIRTRTKKDTVMQAAPVDTTAPSTRQQTTIAPHQQGTVVHPLPNSMVLSWLPLHGYQNKLAIALPCLPLQILRTVQLPEPLIGLSQWGRASPNLPAVQIINTDPFPAEIIEMIQSRCSHADLLALTSVNKAAFMTRFDNPRLQHLCFTTAEQVQQFLSASWETQQTAHLTGIARTREHFQQVKVLTLALSEPLTFQQYQRLFICLSGITQLRLCLPRNQSCASLAPLLQAAKKYLTLPDLFITSSFEGDVLPDELWELNTLETLGLSGLKITHISENISQLNALKSLELHNMTGFKVLPANLCQLKALENLILANLFIEELPEEIGNLKDSLKMLKLSYAPSLKKLPASLGQLEKLETLILNDLYEVRELPEISQLTALKSLKLDCMPSLKTLPISLGQLHKLEALNLTLSVLETLPEEIGQLTTLKSLELRYLNLKALPASIWQLNKLEELTLSRLESVEALPEEIGQLKSLRKIVISFMPTCIIPPLLKPYIVQD
jgi:Leucine-rich repeat (LRR) protein